MVTPELIAAIRREYALNWWGPHGVTHWARVFENGMRLSAQTGARLQVVQLFAVFHDSRRQNEDRDRGHGARGAAFAARLRGSLYELPDTDFELLQTACAGHTEGRSNPNVTVETCWDADRLDLGRVGILPRPEYLGTAAAKDRATMLWAIQRSVSNAVPDFVKREWRA